jgi:hypothetical protein
MEYGSYSSEIGGELTIGYRHHSTETGHDSLGPGMALFTWYRYHHGGIDIGYGSYRASRNRPWRIHNGHSESD